MHASPFELPAVRFGHDQPALLHYPFILAYGVNEMHCIGDF
jgi:hypothetical protein